MVKGFYEEYDRIIRLACPGYDYCLELMARNIPGNAGSVLDLGSGTGNLISSILKKQPGISAYGVELQQGLVEIAKAKVKNPKARFINADILSFDWPSAECITSSLTIHHFSHEQKQRVFKKIFDNSRSFLYFDRIKGKNEAEERKNLDCIFNYMRKNGLPEKIIKEGKKDIEKNCSEG